MSVVVAAVALPLSLVAAPAHGAPAAASRGDGPAVESGEGTLLRIKTKSNRVFLTDGRVLRYDGNDILNAQHLHDVEDAAGPDFFCDLFDSGGEETVARFARSGLEVSVDYLEFRKAKEVSSFFFTINTCDGVVDAADVTP
jgi:hypothetical protein